MTDTRVWSSGVDGGGLAALASIGFQPVGVVMGIALTYGTYSYYWRSSSYGLDPSRTRRYPCPHGRQAGHMNGENWVFTQWLAYTRTSAATAHDRLVEEARALGAHGVVDVRLVRQQVPTGGMSVTEWKMIGTAVRAAGAPELARPFTAGLTAAEFVTLLTSGRVPTNYVLGLGAVSVIPGCEVTQGLNSREAQVVEQLGDAVDMARQVAVEDMEDQARTTHGDEIIGAGIEIVSPSSLSGGATPASFFAVAECRIQATAVRAFDPHQPPRAIEPIYRVNR